MSVKREMSFFASTVYGQLKFYSYFSEFVTVHIILQPLSLICLKWFTVIGRKSEEITQAFVSLIQLWKKS